MTKKIARPKNWIATILADLITEPEIYESLYPINSFRDIMSQLRNHYKVPIRHATVERTTKFGRKIKCRRHYLLSISRDKAIRVYNRINRP